VNYVTFLQQQLSLPQDDKRTCITGQTAMVRSPVRAGITPLATTESRRGFEPTQSPN